MSMNPLDEECVQVSVVPLLGTAMAPNVTTYTVALSHTVPRPESPLRQTYPTDSSKFWDRPSPETRVLETEIICQTL